MTIKKWAGRNVKLSIKGSPMKLVKAHENTKLVKGPRKPKASKRAEEA